jgi:hypothetical protein
MRHLLSLQAPSSAFRILSARKCDMRTTRLMNRAHGTYVRSSIVEVANNIYLPVKAQKTGNALEPSNPIEGDDPWLMLQSQLPKADPPPGRQRELVPVSFADSSTP